MHRPTIALITVVLLVAGAAFYWREDATMASACLRVGLVMGILWFAEPQLRGFPRWAAVLGVVTLVVGALRPKTLILMLPLAALLWFLRPRPARGPR